MTEDLSAVSHKELAESATSSAEPDNLLESKSSLCCEKEERVPVVIHNADEDTLSGRHGENLALTGPLSRQSEREEVVEVCRVCQCAEPDKNGEAALKFLGISFPSHASRQKRNLQICDTEADFTDGRKDKGATDRSQDGNSSVASCDCGSYLEAGPCTCHVDSLIELGCACKSDLGLAHYACALRWFVSRGSMICEICGDSAVNVSTVDQNKVISVLKERNALQAQNMASGSGEVIANEGAELVTGMVIDQSLADGTSMSRGQLLEVTSWFDPHGNTVSSLQVSASEQVVDIPEEGLLNSVSPATKWAVEGTGILIATGLLTVTITWLLAPRVGKGVARKGLNVLLGGLCALSIVVFLRFGVLPRIKYGPARYWAILLVFWFLVFGVWASSTRNSRANN